MSTFNAKRLVGLFLLILVSVGLVMNSMKESEKQKLGRLVESRCAMDGLSKQGCEVGLTLAYLEALAKMLNNYSHDNSNDSAQRKMERVAVEKALEALNSLREESDESLTVSDERVLYDHSAYHSTLAEEGLKGTFSMLTSAELKAMAVRVENNLRIQ